MNREIKFRAWDKVSEIMREVSKIDFYNQCVDLDQNGPDDYFKRRLEDIILLQYTGLKDKNGKEIYEGDVLKNHGIVDWNDVEHSWSAIDLNWNDKRERHAIDYLNCPFEIIGNLHDNPELLK